MLRELWQWREAEAIAANRPPFFILSHEKLVDIAAAAAAHSRSNRFCRRGCRRAAATVWPTPSKPASRFPPTGIRKYCGTKGHRPTEAEMRRYRELEKRRNAHAHKLGIDPTLIASRATLGELARDWDQHAPELMNWQRQLFL